VSLETQKARCYWSTSLAALLLLGAVTYLDYVTSNELLFVFFYFIPISVCAWRHNRTDVVLFSILSAVGWVVADCYSGRGYSNPFYRYWNSLICFACFLSFGLVLQLLKTSYTKQVRAKEELAKALAELETATAEFKKLQSHLQIICAWTNRIKMEDGRWVTITEFLDNYLHIKVSHGISPDARATMLDESKKEY